MALKKILVPVDYSEGSRDALRFAASVAHANGVPLDVVHVWDRPAYVPESATVHPASGETHSLVEMIRENAERELNEFVARADLPTDLAVERRVLSGNPAARILSELSSGRHELVVVGTHGRTGFRHLLLGSVAETLVRRSPLPVLTVPSPERRRSPS